ncbi:uncharacterized protein LOC121389065 [Gigantopelta aegis]|uniref:uncharacterized protein LOC121389065 n=1 Tax=Gigantopelta aegis TaxID=1735272 RepID=UPI001B88A0D5|nr:uncharacterized protein LOC121389065 [Gigantopelta aegis]
MGVVVGRRDRPLLTSAREHQQPDQGSCNESEVRCDNGRCISRMLKCVTYDHCGDGSELCSDDSNWWIWIFIGLVVLLLIVLIILLIVFCIKRKRRSATQGRLNLQRYLLVPRGGNKPHLVNLPGILLCEEL